MILSDYGIRYAIKNGDLKISPFCSKLVRPNSYDIRISDEVRDVDGELVEVKDDCVVIEPMQFLLAGSIESFKLSDKLCGIYHTRSSIGRLGLFTHTGAGLIDAGFYGNLTYELFNCSNKPIKLKVGFPIGQITFHYLTSGCDKPYDGVYNGQRGATISKYIDMIR